MLSEPTLELFQKLQKHFMCDYDESGSIGKRYRRQDEVGTPFCVTYDFETEKTGMVTVRHRDSMEQELVKIEELVEYIQKRIDF